MGGFESFKKISYFGRTVFEYKLLEVCAGGENPGKFGRLVVLLPMSELTLFSLPVAINAALGIPANNGFPVSIGPE
jgi:hypothetical protein